jgi:prepilin-type N-terminal cleavage/methylation domain-containing protein
MKRSGFTMIELIFVIVILGILAAVAIPRLAATRDDAKIATKVQEGTQFLNEMGGYYTAHGVFSKVQTMSNVKLSTSPSAETPADTTDLNNTAAVSVYLTDGNAIGCVKFSSFPKSGDGNITVTNLSGASSICRGLEKALADKNVSSTSGITHTFGGSNVTF